MHGGIENGCDVMLVGESGVSVCVVVINSVGDRWNWNPCEKVEPAKQFHHPSSSSSSSSSSSRKQTTTKELVSQESKKKKKTISC